MVLSNMNCSETVSINTKNVLTHSMIHNHEPDQNAVNKLRHCER